MNPPTLQTFRKLLGGVYPFTLKEIISSKGDMPLPSAHDYYQGTGDSAENRQIMIRKGADLKKRKRPLKKIVDGDAVTLTNQPIFICDENGTRIHTLEILVDQTSVPYFMEQVEDTCGRILAFFDSHDFVKIMPAELSRREYPKAKQILQKAFREASVVFLYFDLKDDHIELILQSAFTGLISAMIGVINKLPDEMLLTLARAGILHFLSYDRLFSGLPPKDAIEQKANSIDTIAAQSGYNEAVRETLQNSHESLVELANESELHKLAQILQTSGAIVSYMEKGVIAIGDKIEQIKGKNNVETSFTKLVIKSNPKVNATCPIPLLHESSVNTLAKAMGYGYIIERERHIRADILRKCPFTNCLSNRATVVCEYAAYTTDYPETNPYCTGLGPSANVMEEGKDGSKMVSRCLIGSKTLLSINEEYSKWTEVPKF